MIRVLMTKLRIIEDAQSIVEVGLIYFFITIALVVTLLIFGETLLTNYEANANKISDIIN